MSETVRNLLFLGGALVVAVALLGAMLRLPPYGDYRGPYGDVLTARVVADRHTEQTVAAITFDYRGVDTFGEDFILFCATAGAAVLLRRKRGEEELPRDQDAAIDRPQRPPNEAIYYLGKGLFPVVLVMGLAMILHGHLTPGGGFQGGVVCASAFLFLYLSGTLDDFLNLAPEEVVELVEAAGAACYAITGIGALVVGAVFLTNVLPHGQTGKLLSAGTIPVLNGGTGLEVGAAFLVILSRFLYQAIKLRGGGSQ